MQHRRAFLFALGFLCGISACRSLAPSFSPNAAQELSRLRSKSVRLMELAERPFESSAVIVEKLVLELTTERDRAQSRQHNQVSVALWDRLLDPESKLLAGFFRRWELEGSLKPAFILEARGLVSGAFDALLNLENQKIGGPG